MNALRPPILLLDPIAIDPILLQGLELRSLFIGCLIQVHSVLQRRDAQSRQLKQSITILQRANGQFFIRGWGWGLESLFTWSVPG